MGIKYKMDEIYKVVTYDTFEKRSIHIDISKILSVSTIYPKREGSYFEIYFMLHDAPICIYSMSYSNRLINGSRIPDARYSRNPLYRSLVNILIHRYPLIFKSINDLEIERFKLLRAWGKFKEEKR